MKNKVEIKKFFGTEVRVVNGDWLVVKDMFNALGRLDDNNQITTRDRNRLKSYLDILVLEVLSIEITGKELLCGWS